MTESINIHPSQTDVRKHINDLNRRLREVNSVLDNKETNSTTKRLYEDIKKQLLTEYYQIRKQLDKFSLEEKKRYVERFAKTNMLCVAGFRFKMDIVAFIDNRWEKHYHNLKKLPANAKDALAEWFDNNSLCIEVFDYFFKECRFKSFTFTEIFMFYKTYDGIFNKRTFSKMLKYYIEENNKDKDAKVFKWDYRKGRNIEYTPMDVYFNNNYKETDPEFFSILYPNFEYKEEFMNDTVQSSRYRRRRFVTLKTRLDEHNKVIHNSKNKTRKVIDAKPDDNKNVENNNDEIIDDIQDIV